jgi:hypothetical protein
MADFSRERAEGGEGDSLLVADFAKKQRHLLDLGQIVFDLWVFTACRLNSGMWF